MPAVPLANLADLAVGQQGWRILDFLVNHPESAHMLTWLLDRLASPQTTATWRVRIEEADPTLWKPAVFVVAHHLFIEVHVFNHRTAR